MALTSPKASFREASPSNLQMDSLSTRSTVSQSARSGSTAASARGRRPPSTLNGRIAPGRPAGDGAQDGARGGGRGGGGGPAPRPRLGHARGGPGAAELQADPM